MTDRETERIAVVAAKDGRFRMDAYRLVLDGFLRAREELRRDADGRELICGVVASAVTQFGMAAADVVRHLGLNDSADVLECVAGMVRAGVLEFGPGESRATVAMQMLAVDFAVAVERRAARLVSDFPPRIMAGARSR